MDFLEHFLEQGMGFGILDFWPQTMRSAFTTYRRPDVVASNPNPNFQNLHKKVIELLHKVHATLVNDRELEENPGYRHMINERLRRQKLKESFKMLNALLPLRSKNDKVCIVGTAALELMDLKREKEELQRRSEDLIRLNVEREDKRHRVTIQTEMASCSTSAIDSVMRVASCVKRKGVTIMSMKMDVTPLMISAMIDVPAMEAKEAEEAVRELLVVGDNDASE